MNENASNSQSNKDAISLTQQILLYSGYAISARWLSRALNSILETGGEVQDEMNIVTEEMRNFQK